MGLQPLQDKIAEIFPGTTFDWHTSLYWADHQHCYVLKGSNNETIEAAADQLTTLCERFGVEAALTMTDVCDSPPRASEHDTEN